MESIYSVLICSRCNKTTIILKEEADDTKRRDKYLSCAHCGSKRVFKEKETNDLRICMKHNSYKRIKGALRQVIND